MVNRIGNFIRSQYGWKFVVEGKGRFPTDMLRYDNCYPTHETDANLMRDRIDARSLITLKTQKEYLTPARWQSFLWNVVEAYPLDKQGHPASQSVI